MGPFAKKCALALAALGTFMLSAYLDFIDIANFIFLGRRDGNGKAPYLAQGRPGTEIEGMAVMGDRPSNDTSFLNCRQLENQRGNAAGDSKRATTVSEEWEIPAGDGYTRPRLQEISYFCLIFQPVRAFSRHDISAILLWFLHILYPPRFCIRRMQRIFLVYRAINRCTLRTFLFISLNDYTWKVFSRMLNISKLYNKKSVT